MSLKEYHKVDLTTGLSVEIVLVDDELTDEDGNLIPIPTSLKKGWGGYKGFFTPVYDFAIDDWVEGKPADEVEYEKIKAVDLELMEKELVYLRDTDWYPIRSFENGKGTPPDVIMNRGKSRDIISDIRLKYNIL